LETKEKLYMNNPKLLSSSSSGTHEHITMLDWSTAIEQDHPIEINNSKIVYRCTPAQQIVTTYNILNAKNQAVMENNKEMMAPPPLTQEELIFRALAIKTFTNPTVH
jgi:hypothetical protein